MAAVSLNSNLAALRAKRALNASSAELSSTLERLSSGKRINHASDDAAGLAVASSLNVTARVQTQAARNVNDGISFLNVADGATSALKDILFRVRELSTQSSNGTFSNAQRQCIDKESQALQAEYGRILDSTSYNGIRVFGSADVVVQAGVGTDAALLVNTSSAVSTTARATGHFRPSNPSAREAHLHWCSCGRLQRRRQERPGNRGLGWQHRERAARQRQWDIPGQAVLRHGTTLTLSLWATSTATARVTWSPRIFASDTASVLLGNGNGTFQARQSFGTGTDPISVAVADFNSDGKSDLVTADYERRHRERAARQRQRNVSGQAVLRHGKLASVSCCGRLQRRRQE